MDLLPARFTDRRRREWRLELNYTLGKHILDVTGLDFINAHDGKALLGVIQSDEKLVQVLWLFCEEQAVAANVTNEDAFFAISWRLIIMPMFLFSGTFYPLSSLPLFLQWIGWISPVWHATDLGRALSYGADVPVWLMIVHLAVPLLFGAVGLLTAYPQFEKRLSE